MTRPLDLKDAVSYWQGVYPMLALKVDGRPALLDAYPKPGVHEAGVVVLGGAFAHLPVITLTPDDGAPLELEGATRDPRLFALYNAFLEAASAADFRPGPIAIPPAAE